MTRVARFAPPIALVASIVSTAALALVLTHAFGSLRPSVPTHWSVRTEQDARVITAGHDEEILRLVVHGADNELPVGARPSIAGIQVEGGRIVLTFNAHPTERLTIRAPEATGASFLRTNMIAASWSGHDVPDTIRSYVAVLAKSPGWAGLWTRPGRGNPAPPQAPPTNAGPARVEPGAPPAPNAEHPLIKESGSQQARVAERSVWLIVLWSLIAGNSAASALLLAGWRQSQPAGVLWRSGPEGARDARFSLLALSMAVMALGVATLASAHFRFRIDDYTFLALATRYPGEITGETRLLSTRAHYQLGMLLGGGRLWFAVSNLALLAALCTCWGLLVHRLGFSRNAAITAGALLAMGPGTFYLLRQANGIEHLSATTCLMLVLLLTDLAAREPDRPRAWRYGVLLLAVCWSVLGVLMKLPLMIVLPPSCWLWGRWLVPRPAAPMHRSATYLAFVVAVGGPMYALTPAAPPLGFLPSRWALAAIGDRLSRDMMAVVLLLAFGGLAGSTTFGGAADAVSRIGSVLRLRAGRLPLLVWAPLLSAVWAVPFVLHAEYEGGAHYGLLVSAPLNAVAAILIVNLTDSQRMRGWRAIAAACIACIILLPLGEIRSEVHRAATEPIPGWLNEVRVLAAARLPPERIVVAPACPPSTFTLPLSRQMTEAYSEIGIWWATGWYEVPVEFHDDTVPTRPAGGVTPNVVTLGYCPGRPATIE